MLEIFFFFRWKTLVFWNPGFPEESPLSYFLSMCRSLPEDTAPQKIIKCA